VPFAKKLNRSASCRLGREWTVTFWDDTLDEPLLA
jgi:hypothetical protein